MCLCVSSVVKRVFDTKVKKHHRGRIQRLVFTFSLSVFVYYYYTGVENCLVLEGATLSLFGTSFNTRSTMCDTDL